LGYEIEVDTIAAVVEMPGDGQSVTAVVAIAAADDDLLRFGWAEHVSGNFARSACGIFHQERCRGCEFLDRQAIHFADLISR